MRKVSKLERNRISLRQFYWNRLKPEEIPGTQLSAEFSKFFAKVNFLHPKIRRYDLPKTRL